MERGDAGETALMASTQASGRVAPAPRPGLRERKRRRTHEAIAAAALELFDRQGFHATTLAQVAEAADVSPRTVSAYFPEKEMLAFPGMQERFDTLVAHLRDRPEGVRATEALRQWIAAMLLELEGRGNELVVRKRVITANPELRAYERSVRARTLDPIAEALARDLGRAPTDLEPRMAAAALLTIFEMLGDEHRPAAADASGTGGHDAALAAIDRALAFIAGGVAALGVAGSG
jgi:AcrR family transcriptional regulator